MGLTASHQASVHRYIGRNTTEKPCCFSGHSSTTATLSSSTTGQSATDTGICLSPFARRIPFFSSLTQRQKTPQSGGLPGTHYSTLMEHHDKSCYRHRQVVRGICPSTIYSYKHLGRSGIVRQATLPPSLKGGSQSHHSTIIIHPLLLTLFFASGYDQWQHQQPVLHITFDATPNIIDDRPQNKISSSSALIRRGERANAAPK
ncbi:hypothetical protein V8C26DRAFT_407214 [Trichoderma gracile]